MSEDDITVEIELGGESRIFKIEINRRRLARNYILRIKSQNTLSISSPISASIFECKNFVFKNADWIFKQLKESCTNLTLREYFAKTPVLYSQGVKLQVSFIPSQSDGFWIEDLNKGEIVFAYNLEKDDSFKNLFLKYAKDSLARTINLTALQTGLSTPKISVRDQRSRWASRSSSTTLSFNWRIILLEPHYQKYIILHEFAHEKFMDHSVSFWIYLNRLIDGARALDRKLTKDGAQIFAIERGV